MKSKIFVLVAITMLFSVNAYAGALATNTLSAPGVSIFGAGDETEAATDKNKLVSLSKGVRGLVNFTASANTSQRYVIACKHDSGTKISSTSNDSTKIYWKQATGSAWAGSVNSSDVSTTTFAIGQGWTEY